MQLNEGSQRTLGVTYTDEGSFEWQVKKILWEKSLALFVTCRKVNELIELERVSTESEVKKTLLRSVSHDLKTPSECIGAFSQDLLDRFRLDGEAEELVRVINMSSKMLLSLVRDILDYQ